MAVKIRTTLSTIVGLGYPQQPNPKFLEEWRHFLNTYSNKNPQLIQLNWTSETVNGTTEETIGGDVTTWLSAVNGTGQDVWVGSSSDQDAVAGTGLQGGVIIGLDKDGAFKVYSLTPTGTTFINTGKWGALSGWIGFTFGAGGVIAGTITLRNQEAAAGATTYISTATGVGVTSSTFGRFAIPCDKAYRVQCIASRVETLTQLTAGNKILFGREYLNFSDYKRSGYDKIVKGFSVDNTVEGMTGCRRPRIVTALTLPSIKFTDQASAAQNEQYNAELYIAIADP